MQIEIERFRCVTILYGYPTEWLETHIPYLAYNKVLLSFVYVLCRYPVQEAMQEYDSRFVGRYKRFLVICFGESDQHFVYINWVHHHC